jgi:hypothetical protein
LFRVAQGVGIGNANPARTKPVESRRGNIFVAMGIPNISSFELGESILRPYHLVTGFMQRKHYIICGIGLTAVTFLTLLALMPLSPACFESIAASLTRL